MSKAICALPTISVSTESLSYTQNKKNNSNSINNSMNQINSVSKTDSTVKLSRDFLDRRNQEAYKPARLLSLRVKKIALDQEITKYHDMLFQYKEVKELEALCQMYKTHLTNLMVQFLDVTQEMMAIQNS